MTGPGRFRCAYCHDDMPARFQGSHVKLCRLATLLGLREVDTELSSLGWPRGWETPDR